MPASTSGWFRRLTCLSRFAAALWLSALAGCAAFTSHYDATAYQHFTSLKAFHLKMLEDHATGNGQAFDEAKLVSTCDGGDLRFREAHEHALGKGDGLRVQALTVLHSTFKENCNLGKRQKRLFGAVYLSEIKPMLVKNYDLAIAGELARVGGNSDR